MKLPGRRAVLGFLAIVAAALVLVALGFFPQEPLRRAVETRLRESLGAGIRIGRLRVVPGRLEATLEDVVIETPMLHAEVPHAHLVLGAESLLGRVLSIRSLELDEPRVLVRASAPSPPGASSPLDRPLLVQSLVVRNGGLTIDHPALGAPLRAEGLEAEGSLGKGALELRISGGAWERASPVALGPAHARLKLSPLLEIELEGLEAAAAGSLLHASGSLGPLGALAPRIELVANLDLAELSHIAGGLELAGRCDAQGRLGSDTAGPRLELDLEPRAAVVLGIPLDGGRLHVLHADGETTVSPSLELLGGKLAGAAHLIGTRTRGDLRVAGLDAARLRAALGAAAPPVAGRLEARASWSGDLERDLPLRLEVEGVGRMAPFSALRWRAKAEGRLLPKSRHVDLSWETSVQGDGAPDSLLAALTLTAQGSARGGAPLAYDGRASGTATLRAPAGPRDIALQVELSGEASRITAAAVALGLGGSVDLEAESEGSRVRRLRARGTGLDLAAAVTGAAGIASFVLESSGPLDRLALHGKARIDGLAWRQAGLGSLELDLLGDSRSPEIRLHAPELGARGEAQITSGSMLRGRLDLDRAPLAPFSPLVAVPLEGSLSGSVDFRGPLATPKAMRAEGRVEAAEVLANGLAARTAHPAVVTYEEGALRIESLELIGEGSRLQASGTLALETGAESSVHVVASADLGHLPVPESWQLSGRVDADVRVGGSLRNPRLAGALTAASVTAAGPGLPPLGIAEARIDLVDDAISVPGLTAAFAGGQAALSGRVPLASVLEAARRRPRHLDPGEEASLRVSWSGVDVGRLLSRIRPESSSSLSGALSGEATLEGGLRALDELRATVLVPKTTLGVEDLPVDVGPVALELRGGLATLPEAIVATRGGTMRLQGRVDLKRRSFDGSGAGRLDLRALAPFLGAVSLSGAAEVDVSASGPFAAPRARGTLSVADVTLRVRDIPQAVTDIRGRVVLDESRLRIEDASASLGGGALSLTGSAALWGATLSEVSLVASGRDMALRYPIGLRTRANADLRLEGRPGAFRLSGSVEARSGRYDLDLVLQESLRRPAPKPMPSPLLRSINLDVGVDVASPIVVRSSLANVRVGGRLSMLGDLEFPEPYGQLDLERDGLVYLQGRPFKVEKGALVYEGTWDPELDVSVESQSRIREASSNSEYRITVTATGNLANPKLGFASVPGLTETQIQSLVATGGLGASGMESGKVVAGDQAASLLAGRLGRGIAGGLGLDQVSIQPQLLSREQDPGAKFTFGKRLTPQVNLAYSLSLTDPEDRFIQLSAAPGKDVTGQVQVREDGTYSFGAGQRLELWGPARPREERRDERVKLDAVRLEGDSPLPEPELREVLGLKGGSKASSWDLQEKADRLRQGLIERGYLESEVVARLEEDTAVFRVGAGPRYRWVVEGMREPPSLDRAMRSAFFADEALDLGRERLLRELRSRGHWRADVLARAEDEAGGRRLVFTVRPGPRYDSAEVHFPGATSIPEPRLLEAAGGATGLLRSERSALDGVRAAYAEAHRLRAEAGPVAVRDEGRRILIEVPVREGPPARIAGVRLAGGSLPEQELRRALDLPAGSAYDDGALSNAGQRLRDHYLGLGYPRVRIAVSTAAVDADVEVTYSIVEGPRLVVGSVEVVGATRTRRSIILGKLELKPGDPLDLRKLVGSERKLRDLALFRRVAIGYSDESPSPLRIEVEEQAAFTAGYQLRYNQDDGPSGELEAEARNLAGTGLTLGARYRRGADVDEQRASLDLPSFFRGRLTASAFRLFEELPTGADTGQDLGKNRRTQQGFQVQQTLAFRNRWDLLVGYRFKRVVAESPFLVEPVKDNIASLDLSLVRETRDNPLDPRRGRFLSFSLELSPKALASDLTFVKGFAQAFVNRPLGSRLTWAQGYRLGLATGFGGQRLISSERFTAGGANSLRGFETDSVGPRDFLGDPTGGQAVVIFNQELRLHHRSGFGGAAFYDGGNVFASVRDMSLDLRHVLGAGLRYTSPVGLLRLDLGLPLFRKPGEKAYQVFFSVGQAF